MFDKYLSDLLMYKKQKNHFEKKTFFLPDHMRDGKIVDDAFGEVEAHKQVDTLSNDARNISNGISHSFIESFSKSSIFAKIALDNIYG